MQKRFALIFLTASFLFFSCSTDIKPASSENSEDKDSSPKNYVTIKNTTGGTLDVFDDSLRHTLLGDIAAGESESFSFSGEEKVFYLTYHVDIGLDVPFYDNSSYIIFTSDGTAEKSVSLPTSMDVNPAYLVLENNSSDETCQIELMRGSANLIPNGKTSTLLDAGDSAVYEISKSYFLNYSSFYVDCGGESYTLPSAVSYFEKGVIYTVSFTGSSAELVAKTPFSTDVKNKIWSRKSYYASSARKFVTHVLRSRYNAEDGTIIAGVLEIPSSSAGMTYSETAKIIFLDEYGSTASEVEISLSDSDGNAVQSYLFYDLTETSAGDFVALIQARFSDSTSAIYLVSWDSTLKTCNWLYKINQDSSDYLFCVNTKGTIAELDANTFALCGCRENQPFVEKVLYDSAENTVTATTLTIEASKITGTESDSGAENIFTSMIYDGTEYKIGESAVVCGSASYTITAKTDTGFTCSLGTFTKDTDNVFKIGSIPVFRNGGSNIEYTVTFVGFSDSARAATAGSTAGNLGSGYTATATNETYTSYSETAESDSDGKLTFSSPVAGTPNIITVSASDGTTVTATVMPKNSGENVGTIAVVESGRYSLKVTGEITTDTSDDGGYLYAGNTYEMTVTVANTTEVRTRPANIRISSDDSRVSVGGNTSGDVPSFTSGTLTYYISVIFSSLTEEYLDTGLNVIFEDADGYIWSDFIPLRIFKGKETINFYAKGVSNNDCVLNGFAIYPDGYSQYFSVPSGSSKCIEVPSFPATEPYKLAFSGAALGSSVSTSTEMRYSFGVNIAAEISLSSYAITEIANSYEPNETETAAYSVDIESAVVAYLETDDIDFYSVPVNADDSSTNTTGTDDFPTITTASYTVNHYLENTDCASGNETYTLDETETLYGTVGEETSATAKSYTGFTSKTFEQSTVQTNDSTTVNIYYNRNSVTLTFDANGGTFADGNTTKTLSGKYENTIDTSEIEEPTYTGKKFTSWENVPETFPLKTATYYAVWFSGMVIAADDISDLDLSALEEEVSIKLTGSISSSNLSSLVSKIKESAAEINLNLSNATGITTFSTRLFASCTKLKSIMLLPGVQASRLYAFLQL